MNAWLAVLPPGTRIVPVGGIDAGNMGAYWAAGARGFGFGSSLYKPGDTIDQTRNKAARIAAAMVAIKQ